MTAPFPAVPAQDTVIGTVLQKFAAGDPSLFALIAEDIDFRIDHYRDEADTEWQVARSQQGLVEVVTRLGQEVFPKGTQPIGITCYPLGDGWHLTCFDQAFFYGVRQRDVTSLTYIVSHERDGLLDYFRETVTNIKDA